MVSGPGENLTTGHLSRMAISKVLAGESNASLPGPMAAHLAGCPECQSAVAAARTQSDPVAERFPTFAALDTVIKRRREREAKETSFFRAALQRLDGMFRGLNRPLIGTGFATLLVLGLGTWVWKARQPSFEPDHTAKGGEAPAQGGFFLYLNGSQAYGDTLRAGPPDTVQLGIVSPRPVHYAVLYRDDDQPLGVYMGGSESGSAPLGSPQGEPLPKSLILAGEWKREILYCLWADRPFTIAEAKRRIEGHADQRGDLRLRTILLGNRAP